MPELPEVETIRSTLEPMIKGSLFKTIQVTLPRIVRKQPYTEFISRATSCTCSHIERRGKFIIVRLQKEDNKLALIIHLGMTGALFCVDDLSQIPDKYRKHIHVLFSLDDGRFFAFSDIRTFGGIRIFTDSEFNSKKLNASILNMGPEVFWDDAQKIFLSNLEKKKHLGIKNAILNQNIVAGVGNIYACEVLFSTGIHPLTPISLLADEKKIELFHSIKEIFLFSISVGGSSISDYVDAHGKKGRFQEYFKIYNKKECKVCATPVGNVKIDGRSSFFCPTCQKK